MEDVRTIVRTYLTSWFVIDALSVGVSGLDIYNFVTRDENNGGQGQSHLRLLRVVRALRLIKLLRLMRASR